MKKHILTAGPSISSREVRYVTDAVRNGWNKSWNRYIIRFENAFAEYAGAKYALSTSSCTGALHLALAALGIGPGDEVIVPDLAWIATASAVEYVGAKVVFADIERDTWCVDPVSIRERITRKTKAIIPVHLYGHPCDMRSINSIAKKYGLYVIEDAAPSAGAEYYGKKTGALADIGTFSFQGAKILVCGEGGMFLTDSKKIYDRARIIGDHGRDLHKIFWINETGYKYKMSNIQAALGLAQLERLDSFVAKKRMIFNWYKQRLSDIEGLQMSTERPGVKNIFWMSSVVLNRKFRADRDECIKRLKVRGIDSRPFFYPASSFRMYRKADNPVSYYISKRAINLPSGLGLTERDIARVAQELRKILGV